MQLDVGEGGVPSSGISAFEVDNMLTAVFDSVKTPRESRSAACMGTFEPETESVGKVALERSEGAPAARQ